MILSVASQKGGTGKTTTSISLAAGLARKGKRVLLIDTDSQANSSKVLLPNYQDIDAEQTLYATILERKPLPIHDTSVPGLSIAPAHILLSNTDIELTSAIDHREARVRRELEKRIDQFDEVIIDCPPALSWLTINAFTASDQVLVVVSPGYFELDSTVQLGKSIQNVRDYFNPDLKLAGFVFTMSEPTINSATSLKILRQTYTDDVLNTVIPKNVDIREAHFKQQDIFAYSPQSKSARAYEKLITELYGV
jgi:chromosome partitioning protein